MSENGHWPALPPLDAWEDTQATVHMWTQIAGKVRLELAPQISHCWGSTLYVTSRGLTTSAIPFDGGSFTIDFDFISHALSVMTSKGQGGQFALRPMSVAEFYRKLFAVLEHLGIRVRIYKKPVEVIESIPFPDDDKHASYDSEAIHRFWLALVSSASVMERFRSAFMGKVSPVHFFWGAFDLAVTRFSGRRAPRHPGGVPNCPDRVMYDAYSHEVSSAGFWPGTGLGEAAYYSYAYPEPEGFRERMVKPEAAGFDEQLGEFVLPYEAVRSSTDPDMVLLAFLESTYESAADLAAWDRVSLERGRRQE